MDGETFEGNWVVSQADQDRADESLLGSHQVCFRPKSSSTSDPRQACRFAFWSDPNPATNPDDAFVYSQLKTISLGTPGIAAFYTHTSTVLNMA